MLLQSKTKALAIIPEGRCAEIIDSMIECLDPKGSALTRDSRGRQWLGVVLYNLLHRHIVKAFWKDEATDCAYVCLPRGSQYYSGKYIEDRPHLKAIFSPDKLTYRLATHINSWLRRKNVCVESTGSPYVRNENIGGVATPTVVTGWGRMTRLLLMERSAWSNPGITLLYYELTVEINRIYQPTSLAVCRVRTEDGIRKEVPASPGYVKTMEIINAHTRAQRHLPEAVKSLMQYRLIFGEHEHSHGRLYAPLSFMPKRERAQLMADIGYVEHDIASCAPNIMYAIQTGEFFNDLFYGSDIYSALIEDIIRLKVGREADDRYYYMRSSDKERSILKFLRPVMKKILTIGSGKTCESLAQVRQTISVILMDAGMMENRREYRRVERKWLREYKKANGHDYDHIAYPPELRKTLYELAKKARQEAREKWEAYCLKNNLPRVRLSQRWKFMPQDIIEVLKNDRDQKWKPIWNFLFHGSFIHTQSVETLANLRLHEWAVARGLHIFTLHDAVFCAEAVEAEVIEAQKQFILEAAKLKRTELVLIDRFSEVCAELPSMEEVRHMSWGPFKTRVSEVYLQAKASSWLRCQDRFSAKKADEQVLKRLAKTFFTKFFKASKKAGGVSKDIGAKNLFMDIVSPFLFPFYSFDSLALSTYRITIGKGLGDKGFLWDDFKPDILKAGMEKAGDSQGEARIGRCRGPAAALFS